MVYIYGSRCLSKRNDSPLSENPPTFLLVELLPFGGLAHEPCDRISPSIRPWKSEVFRGKVGALGRASPMDGDAAHPLKDSILTGDFFDGNNTLNPLANTFDNQDLREIRASEMGGSDITGELEDNQTPIPPQQLAQLNGGDGDDTEPPTAVRKAGPGEFELLKVIGMGAFGQVLQASAFTYSKCQAYRTSSFFPFKLCSSICRHRNPKSF